MEQAAIAPPAHDAHAAHGAAETSTGVTNTKLAMWIFLSSECLLFGALISTYLLYRGRSKGISPSDVYNIPFTSATSFILLMSSLTMVLALAAIQRADYRRTKIWLVATALFGMTFIGGQIYEFTEFSRQGLTVDAEPVRLELLPAHRSPRAPRHRGHRVAAVAVGPRHPGQAAAAALRDDRDRRAVLALRRRGVDRDLHRRVPDPEVEVGPRHERRRDDHAEPTQDPEHNMLVGTAEEREREKKYGLEEIPPEEVPLLPGELTHHPSPFQYVVIAMILVVITAARGRRELPRRRHPERPDHLPAASAWVS